MAVLAFETSTAQGSVAVVEGEKVLASRTWLRDRSHSELLTAEIEAVLAESNLKPNSLRALAIGHGPGSFTGLRVAVNAAKSLGYALNLKTYSFDTHTILANGVERTDLPVLVLINAQKNAFFSAVFKREADHWTQTRPLELTHADDLDSLLKVPHLGVGDGFLELGDELSLNLKSLAVRDSATKDYPHASILGRMSENTERAQAPLVWNEVQALYIRASGAEEKLREGLKR